MAQTVFPWHVPEAYHTLELLDLNLSCQGCHDDHSLDENRGFCA